MFILLRDQRDEVLVAFNFIVAVAISALVRRLSALLSALLSARRFAAFSLFRPTRHIVPWIVPWDARSSSPKETQGKTVKPYARPPMAKVWELK